MATMNISLPDTLKDWAERRADGGDYGNTSDYVRDLIRRDKERSEKIKAMQMLVDEARAGGVSARSMDQIRQEALRRASSSK
jgi:antitoxin ParD1/3/4